MLRHMPPAYSAAQGQDAELPALADEADRVAGRRLTARCRSNPRPRTWPLHLDRLDNYPGPAHTARPCREHGGAVSAAHLAARRSREQVVADRRVVAPRGGPLKALDNGRNLLCRPRNGLRARGRGTPATSRQEANQHGGDRGLHGARIFSLCMEGSAPDSVGTISSWLRCYRCWSTNLEAQIHYEGVLKIDASTGEAADPVDEVQEAVIQCLDCLHDQPHLALTLYEEDGRRVSRVEAVEDRWERMVVGTPWVASCTVTVDGEQVETCSGPDAAESLSYAAFGDNGTREFFTHVRFHKHDGDQIVVHMLVELYARSQDEATDVLEQAARGDLAPPSLAKEPPPPAAGTTSGGADAH